MSPLIDSQGLVDSQMSADSSHSDSQVEFQAASQTPICNASDTPYTALFGGSFDPFHLGHLEIIKSLFMLQTPLISRVVLMPTFCNPLKTQSLFSPSLRLEMCEQIAHDMRHQGHCVEASDFEVRQNRAVYSIESVEFLLQKSFSPLVFVLGEDSFGTLAHWREAGRLCEMVEFIVVRRGQGVEQNVGQHIGQCKGQNTERRSTEQSGGLSSPHISPSVSPSARVLATLSLTHNPNTWASSHIKALFRANATHQALELIPQSLHRFWR